MSEDLIRRLRRRADQHKPKWATTSDDDHPIGRQLREDADLLNEAADLIEELTHLPEFCSSRSPHKPLGYFCMGQVGHEGEHWATNTKHQVLATWNDEPEPSEIQFDPEGIDNLSGGDDSPMDWIRQDRARGDIKGALAGIGFILFFGALMLGFVGVVGYVLVRSFPQMVVEPAFWGIVAWVLFGGGFLWWRTRPTGD